MLIRAALQKHQYDHQCHPPFADMPLFGREEPGEFLRAFGIYQQSHPQCCEEQRRQDGCNPCADLLGQKDVGVADDADHSDDFGDELNPRDPCDKRYGIPFSAEKSVQNEKHVHLISQHFDL